MGYQIRNAESIEQFQTIVRYAEFLFDRKFPVLIEFSEVESDVGWQNHALYSTINQFGLVIDDKISMIISLKKTPKVIVRCYRNQGPVAIFIKEIYDKELVERIIHMGFMNDQVRDYFLKSKDLVLLEKQS